MENERINYDDRTDPAMGHLKKKNSEAEKKALLNRMSRAMGHMDSIKRMIEDDRDPTEILIQLAAVRSAVSGVSRLILQSHIEESIQDAIDNPDEINLDDLNKVISYFIK